MNRGTRRRQILAGVLMLLTVMIVLFVSFREPGLGDVPRLNGSTVTIVPGIHLLGNLGPAAAYVVETPQGLVLIDSGLDRDARLLKSEMTELGLDWKRLHAIFLTHVHGDHSGGAEHLRAETGAKVYAGQADVAVLSEGSSRDAFFGTFEMPNHSPHPTTVDVALEGDESIAFGPVRVQVLSTPGHTLGSTCYLLERAGLRVLFAGDVIVRLGEKPLGTYTTYMAPRYRGDAQSYLASLRKLRALAVPDLVLPGHPRASRTPQSPRLTQPQWNAMLAAGIREMEQLVSRQTAASTGH
ncbi:MAG: MBL fold metallo-hydrolase [Planctomycetaceae bacterium]